MDGDPERRPFLDKLLHFMEERGTPIAQCPTISKNPLDLYRLYLFTKEKGGFMEVCMPGPSSVFFPFRVNVGFWWLERDRHFDELIMADNQPDIQGGPSGRKPGFG